MKLREPKCSSLFGVVSWWTMRPVLVSATKRSMLTRLRLERKAT
jgi:hypothetical protein